MNYRTFVDLKGVRWEVWLVLPAAAERRAVERRRTERRVAARGRRLDRRVEAERRRHGHRRVGVAPNFANGWLCFESDDEKRRLAPVPENWEIADADELEALCKAAKHVIR
jgi:hypothetical protein